MAVGGEGGKARPRVRCSYKKPKSIGGGETSPPHLGAHLRVHTDQPPPLWRGHAIEEGTKRWGICGSIQSIQVRYGSIGLDRVNHLRGSLGLDIWGSLPAKIVRYGFRVQRYRIWQPLGSRYLCCCRQASEGFPSAFHDSMVV